ncbi:hypothetical protein KAR91_37050 [Candidatus Pacearchaeota archaeon]|nr:hypothetical protein [Candidatus Pacearchaeota archaeon]
MDLMTISGMGVYNQFIENVNKEKNNHLPLFMLRRMALARIKRYYGDAGLQRVLEGFIEHRPHWDDPRKAAGINDNFEACIYFIAHMEEGFRAYSLKSAVKKGAASLANDYTFTTVNSRGKRVVNILNKISPEKAKQSYCQVHPDKKATVRDLCGRCYSRVRGLTQSGMIDENTSPAAIREVLNLKKRHSSNRFFAEAGLLLMAGIEGE